MEFPIHESERVRCEWHSLQPGDGTAYEFLISDGVVRNPPRPDPSQVFIASVQRGAGRPMFGGYLYHVSSILEFVQRWGELLWAPKDRYHRGIVDSELGRIGDPFSGYMCEPGHSNCNPWTALAAIRCAAEFKWGSDEMGVLANILANGAKHEEGA